MVRSVEKRRRIFPRTGGEQEQLRFLLDYAILAPSSHNSQPWLFRLNEDSVDLFADRQRALPVVDPAHRELIISCGAALDHLAVAARRHGREPIFELLPEDSDPDHLAIFWLGDEAQPTAEDVALFNAITDRRTNRQVFEERLPPRELQDRCEELTERQGATLTIVSDEKEKTEIADLVAEGDRIQFSDPEFRRELSAWVHSRRSDSHDGMSGDNFGVPDFLSPMGALVIRTFDIGNGVAAGDAKKIMEGSPLLGVISTPGDVEVDWMRAGGALSHMLLKLTSEGVSAGYLNQPIEVARLRPLLQDIVAVDGMPQLLLRIGYGAAARSSARRPLAEVLI